MWWSAVFLVFYSAQVAWSLNVKKKLDEHPMPRSLSESKLSDLAQRTDYQRFTEDILKNIMRVRVPGTVGHHKVKLFIKDQFKHLNWTVTVDEFDSDTPLGFKRFTNIIATLNPNAKKRLVLAAHYDSKLYDQKNDQKEYFLGATDSAVPCAMLIEIARVVTPLFKAAERNHANRDAWPESDEGDVTLQMIFFDGEEAFVEWTKNDSLYGARHLAELWEKTPHPSGINDTNLLSSITAFVLLDLIGSSTPVFYNMFRETNDLFERLQFIERRLMTTNQIINHADTYFMTGLMDRRYFVEDDHIPFLERNVKILHLIPLPFPPCWHKYCDDNRALDHNVIHDLLKILQVFVVEYFGLRISE